MEVLQFIGQYNEQRALRSLQPFGIRIGVHTGPVVAGIVGTRKFAYDIRGDSVNLAARMESSGEQGRIDISGATYERIKDAYSCTYRGKVAAKNKGLADMYFVNGAWAATPAIIAG